MAASCSCSCLQPPFPCMIFHDLIPGDYFPLLQRTSAETSTAPQHSWVQLAAAGHSWHDCQLQATRLQPACPPILTGAETLTKMLLVLAETPTEQCVPSEPSGGQATWCRPLLRTERSDCKDIAVSKPGGFDWRKWDNLHFQSTRKDDFRQTNLRDIADSCTIVFSTSVSFWFTVSLLQWDF